MKTILINGSPRKNGNTAKLLKEAQKGAESKNNETRFINLYDLNFKGCISCFECKKIGSKSYGKCVIKDDLTSIFKEIEESDTLILGSPIYLSNITGIMQSFLERLMFQYIVYDENYSSLAPKKIKTGFIFTMNVTEELAKQMGYMDMINTKSFFLKRTFSENKFLISTNTYQFHDYSKYETSGIDIDSKIKQKEEQFPKDCIKAYELGVDLA